MGKSISVGRRFTVSQRPATFLIAVSMLAFALRAYHLGYQSLWRDESDALRFATGSLADLLGMVKNPAQNGPLFFVVLRYWLAAAGHSEFALRFLSACLGTLAVPISYNLVVRLAGRQAAALTALAMAVAPYLVWYGQEAKMYALLTFLVPLGLYLVLRAVQRGGWRYWILLYVVTSLSVYAHLLAALTIPLQLIWILLAPAEGTSADERIGNREQGVDHDEGRGGAAQGAGTTPYSLIPAPFPLGKRALSAAAYLVALAVPYLPVLHWALPMFLSFSYRTGFPFVPLPGIFQSLANAWAGGIAPPSQPPTLSILLATWALLSGSVLWVLASGRSGWRPVAMLGAWLLLPPIEIYIVSLSVPLFTERYLIWAVPAFLALQAMGVVVLLRSWRPLGILTAGAILALGAPTLGMQAYRPIKSDFRGAAAYVMAHGQPGDRLIFQIPYDRYLFEYYAGPVADGRDGPYTNNGMTDAELNEEMSQATAAAPAVWLVASEVSMWDERGMTEAWLDAHARLVERSDLTLVSVSRDDLR